ncbi:photosystem reaction center subunit H [Alsobacter metallidurans]|uniref:Photosystem reaction center subunit H n=1 Tax=Alsobacter metallidurans TaxID=340221 RepID=A0A917I2J1_9HYPH|nr:PRC-barrel domain-containing protein [Alsobacter metallidurans]GGH05855.1 photosystem reaction center subunit H [Alsobacter metallidurans]
MLKAKLATSLIATVLLAGTAIAQTNPSTPAPATTAPSATSSPSMGASSGSVQFITNDQAGQWRGSKLMGVDIYGPNDEKVGDVSDVLLDHQGNIKGVVIGVGGFLGMGEKDVAVPFNAIQWSETPRKATTASNAGSTASGSAGMNTASTTAAAPAAPASTDTTGTVARSGDNARTYPDHGMISMTKDQLKSAPAYNLK